MEYSALNALFLRTPAFSFQDYDLDNLEFVLASTQFRNAIRLASKPLYQALLAKNFEMERLDKKERISVSKYFNRMCFRSTPFAAFASFSLLDNHYQTIVLQPETAAIKTLADNADLQKDIRVSDEQCLVTVNPSLYRTGKSWRFFADVPGEKGKLQFAVNAIETGRFNNAMIKYLNQAPVKQGDLQQWVVEFVQCEEAEAAEYLRFLVEEDVLYLSKRKPLIGSETPQVLPIDFNLNQAPKNTVYCALQTEAIGTESDAELKLALEKAANILQRIAPLYNNTDLQSFTKRFKARFDLERVPLLVALDPDCGIFYKEHFQHTPDGRPLDGIPLPNPKRADSLDHFREIRALLLRSWRAGKKGPMIELRRDDLPEIPTGQFPPSLPVLYKSTTEGILIESSGGSSATTLVGRFSLFSEDVNQLCREIVQQEQTANPDVVFADVDHRNDLHVDNINRRAAFYGHVIPVNCFPDYPGAEVISLNDLYLSVRDGQLILESERLGKRVVPRLSTAYNFRHAENSVFRLLCDLQYQGLQGVGLPDLEQVLPGLMAYPRVSCEGLILSPAKWVLPSEKITNVFMEQADPKTAIKLLQLEFGFPQHILLGETDRQLYFDLEKEKDIALFKDCIADDKKLVIREYLFSDRRVSQDAKAMVAQFVAFLSLSAPSYRPLARQNPVRKNVKRNFPPGSDWLYLKLYCRPTIANEVLADVIRPVVRKWEVRAKAWFFIRYEDEKGPHIRLRFEIAPNEHAAILIDLRQRLEKSSKQVLIKEILVDTYQREIERYGPSQMINVERAFNAGSNLVLHFIHPEMTAKDEFKLATQTVHRMLQVYFTGDLGRQGNFAHTMAEGFRKELKLDSKAGLIALDKKYRELKPLIEECVAADLTTNAQRNFDESLAFIMKYAAEMPAERLIRLQADLIHLQVNRCFSQEQRQNEMLVYYCLAKFLKSQFARNGKSMRGELPIEG